MYAFLDKNANDLSWNTRLKIALDVAQGTSLKSDEFI